jgi:hypothetical protein
VAGNRPAKGFQFATEPLAVCVKTSAAGEFRTDGEDFCEHGGAGVIPIQWWQAVWS